MPINSEAEYRSKKDQVLQKFKKQFVETNYLNDPMFHSIIELLIRGADPYEIIEMLIDDKKEMIKRVKEFMELHGQPILFPKEK